MEKMSPLPQRSPSIVPLARDQDGNPIVLPDDAMGWRIRRQTGGRPRLLLDAKKQPMAFPLDYTTADVEDILPPGNYLLDAVDKAGEPVGVTIGVSLGMPRNAEVVEPDDENQALAAVPAPLPGTTSEVRLVLEANVRATQMAFLHNQRTLELGLRMAETLRDSVQVLANAQADWIKSVSSARGFFRNAAQPLPPVEVKQLTVQTGGEDNDEEEVDDTAGSEPAAAAHWSAPFVPIVHSVVQQLGPAVMAWATKQSMGGKGARDSGSSTGSGSGSSSEDRSPSLELRDFVDWQYAHQKQAAYREKKAAAKQVVDEQAERQAANAEHAAKLTAAITAASSPGPGIDVLKLMQMLPQRTAMKLMELQGALTPDEQTDVMKLFHSYGADGLADLLHTFDRISIEEATGFLRRLLAEWNRGRAAKRTAPTEPPNGNGTRDTSGSGSTEPR